MNKILIVLLLSFFSVFAKSKSTNGRLVDAIAAVVGDSVILKSDVNEFVEMKIQATGESADALIRNMLYDEALDEMIDGLVLLVHSENDTNITISKMEINDKVNQRIESILQQNHLTMDQLAQALKKEQNMTIDEFKAKLYTQIQNEYVKQKVMQFYLVGTDLSREEVKEFYNEYKDSLPKIGESVRLQKLLISLKSDSASLQNGYQKILDIRDQIVESGEDFSELAKKYSDGPNAKNGGDLGYISKGTLSIIPLEQAAFTLQPGEVSNPIRTKLGWHLIEVIDRETNKVHIKHILISVKPDEKEVKMIDSLFTSIQETKPDSAQFAEIVKEYSTLPMLKAYGGVLDWQRVSTLKPNIKSAFASISTVGSFSKPITIDNDKIIFRIDDYTKNRELNLTNDYTVISNYAKNQLMQKKLADLVKKWRNEVFIQKYK